MKAKSKNLLIYIALFLAIASFLFSTLNLLHGYNFSIFGANQSIGNTTKGIDTQLSAQQLSVINNAPSSYFEIAANKLINGTLNNTVLINASNQQAPFFVNGKPSVIYIGAISCIFCGENRWAMALALSRFGNFSRLYVGYSSLGDGDVPTLYWDVDNYTTSGNATFGNFYSSNTINFISAEYDSPIKQGFEFPNSAYPISYFVARAPNSTYYSAMQYMNKTNGFRGTPFTLWGRSLNIGADAIVFGNSSDFSGTAPLTKMSHQQVFNQLSSFNDQFSWSEYAAADVYVAEMCASTNNSTPICTSPSIRTIQSRLKI